MRHIILTRISTFDGWSMFEPSFDRCEVMREREALFEKFTMPSVLGQTVGDFEWWLFFGEDNADDEHREKSQEWAGLDRRIRIEWREKTPTLGAMVDEGSVECGRLLTTRLDSDDVLSKDFVEVLREESGREDCFLNPLAGYVYCEKLNFVRKDRNQFQSRIETGRKRTVWQEPHHVAIDGLRTVDYSPEVPTWVWVIHELNLSSRMHPDWLVGLAALSERTVNLSSVGDRFPVFGR